MDSINHLIDVSLERVNKNMKCLEKGVSLVEILITVVVIGVMAAIAIPSYQGHVETARRAEAIGSLAQLQIWMESEYRQHSDYPETAEFTSELPKLGIDQEFYSFKLVISAESYAIEAMPKASQQNDRCKTLSVNHMGVMSSAEPNCV
ncbi:prepilin-type N-terminal cleavage/methylation domain-containing protein [Parasalinivibrio latis]|uniref:type IV pilin protein n=1 Tax=Parasalinivibrio latis TaxID=2952610 RepID=UPI0030DE4280